MQATSADRRRGARVCVWPRRPPLWETIFQRPKECPIAGRLLLEVVSDAPMLVPPVPQASAGCPTAAAQLETAAVQAGRRGVGWAGRGCPAGGLAPPMVITNLSWHLSASTAGSGANRDKTPSTLRCGVGWRGRGRGREDQRR